MSSIACVIRSGGRSLDAADSRCGAPLARSTYLLTY